MASAHDTIFALASGALPSGVAVVRVSGDRAFDVWSAFGVPEPSQRRAALRTLRDGNGDVLDTALVLRFDAPRSFTGEDVVELHCHGGRAVVAAVLARLASLSGFRMAEAGEFSRRAFANGRLDLTELEGLSDLIAAETETQRRQAVAQAGGALRRKAEDWRIRLVRARALLEASFDFADEEDVPGDSSEPVRALVAAVRTDMATALARAGQGRMVRDGVSVVLAGPTNAGKSSLLNALAQEEVAIVTDIAGTTRDLLSVELDIGGVLVRVTDTAGLRETEDPVERIGVERAREAMAGADLVLWLIPSDGSTDVAADAMTGGTVRYVQSKADLALAGNDDAAVAVSTVSEGGLVALRQLLQSFVADHVSPEPATVVRERQRNTVQAAVDALDEFAVTERDELQAEALRRATSALSRLVGDVDVEDLLDVIFAEFCVGK